MGIYFTHAVKYAYKEIIGTQKICSLQQVLSKLIVN